MQASRGRKDIASTHSSPWHQMGWLFSVMPQPCFTPSTHWIGGWVGLRAGLDTEARRKTLCSCRESNPGHPVCTQTLYWLRYQSSQHEIIRGINCNPMPETFTTWLKRPSCYFTMIIGFFWSLNNVYDFSIW
jgi:hypothetical protein